jgi:hypothetical protein
VSTSAQVSYQIWPLKITQVRFIQLGGVAVEAAGAGGVTERGLVARLGVVGGCGPECRRGELIAAVAPAVLVEVVREPVHRPARDVRWGGNCCASTSNGGEAYTPATNTWRALPAAPVQPRRAAMGAWTGKELVVAGGVTGEGSIGSPVKAVRSAAAYNPATRTWRKLPLMPAGTAVGGTAVWDGKEVLFLGVGTAFNSPSARGVAYNPATNRWRRLPAMPFARDGFAAVWTGRQALVWGGLTGAGVPPPHGEAFNPATNRWTALPASPLRGRADPTAVWTGRQMIVWGGDNKNGKSYTDGAAYTPGAP